MKNWIVLFAIFIAGALSACGGGGGGSVSTNMADQALQSRVLEVTEDNRDILATYGGEVGAAVLAGISTVTVVLNDEDYQILLDLIDERRMSQIESTMVAPSLINCPGDLQNTGGICSCPVATPIFRNGKCLPLSEISTPVLSQGQTVTVTLAYTQQNSIRSSLVSISVSVRVIDGLTFTISTSIREDHDNPVSGYTTVSVEVVTTLGADGLPVLGEAAVFDNTQYGELPDGSFGTTNTVLLTATRLTPFGRHIRLCSDSEHGVLYRRTDTGANSIYAQSDNGFFYTEIAFTVRRTDDNGNRLNLVPDPGQMLHMEVQEGGALKYAPPSGETPFAFKPGDVVHFEPSYFEGARTATRFSWHVFEQSGEFYFADRLFGAECDVPEHNSDRGWIFQGWFAFPSGMFEIPQSITVFSLRENLRGHIDGNAAIRLENFFFREGGDFRDIHLEYQHTPFEARNFSLNADGGFRRWGASRTNATYGKITGTYGIADNADIYMQLSRGTVSSGFYRDGKLHGASFGVFADSVFRHDDSYHVRMEQPFAAKELAEWQFSANARFGEESNYLRFGILRDFSDNENRADIFWLREF